MNANSSGVRAMLAECAIAVSVCAAGYIFLVDPAKQDLIKARSQVTAALAEQSQRAGADTLTETQVAELRTLVNERATRIQTRSEQAKDQATLFGAIMALGAEHKVRIDQLQPGTTAVIGETLGTPAPRQIFAAAPGAPATGAPDPAAAAPEPAKPRDVRTTCTLIVQGSYSNITDFLGALQHELGYANILDVRLSPAGESSSSVVTATIQTEHFAFDLMGILPGGKSVASATTNGTKE